ncbi:unnamed protein product, partial [Staurois parvus]
MPHISAHLSCLSVPRISATYQCRRIDASQCHLSVHISVSCQCLSVPPISAISASSSVPISTAYQCSLSV